MIFVKGDENDCLNRFSFRKYHILLINTLVKVMVKLQD